ncbi:sushi domain-containing protein 4 isoform X2 [Megalops cyprinoides]|uniref:sushi domain-containing protein 4 isoform X2 n=1 Tax=Megalops cyprinoides TaxID=118141 RepID=UPI001863BF64|nr:sushi domain-containing protein 4 isoform X2 [Megalops cyprinoides]
MLLFNYSVCFLSGRRGLMNCSSKRCLVMSRDQQVHYHTDATVYRKLLLLLTIFHLYSRSNSSDFSVDQQFCPDPGFPLHGHRTPSSGVFFEGSVAHFSCMAGFRLQGPAKMMCTQVHNGQVGWKPNHKPACLAEECLVPHIADAEVQNQTYRPGDQLVISCHDEFQIRYPDTDIMQSVCQDDGSWDNLPVCQGCLRPIIPPHSYVNISEAESSLPVGALVRYQCFPGYKLDGAELLECMYNLIWSDVPPRCLDVEVCPLPPMVEHGDYECHPQPCDRYIQGTVVEFFCDPGYTLSNDYSYITCQHGQWSPNIQVNCVLSEPSWPRPPDSILSTWKVVAFTATSVLLGLLLVIVGRTFQISCKAWCDPRDYPQEPTNPNVLVVDGVPVVLPSYDEAVAGGTFTFPGIPPPAGLGDSLYSEEQGLPAYPGHDGDPSEMHPNESTADSLPRTQPGVSHTLSEANDTRASTADTASTSPSVDIADGKGGFQ